MKNKTQKWPNDLIQIATELHTRLSLTDQNWHNHKNDNSRRTAELLAGALIQLLKEGETEDIEALIDQSLLWIRKEVKDPGCPDR